MPRLYPRLVTSAVAAVLCLGATSSWAQAQRSAAVQAFVAIDEAVVALTNANLIDGRGTPSAAAQTVILRDGRIDAVGPSATVRVPADAEVIDLAGKTIVPGFVMLHEHMFYPSGQGAYNQMQFSFPRLYLAGGATTIRTAGSRDPYGDLNLKAAIDAGNMLGPRMDVTGPYVNGPGLPILFVNSVEDPEEARWLVRYWSDEGASSFKVYMHISRAQLAATLDEAHARGAKVTGHLCSVTYGEAAQLGLDNLEHGFFAATDFVANKAPDECPSGAARNRSLLELDPDGPAARALIDKLVAAGVAITSTLPVFEISTPGRPRASNDVLDALAPDARDRYLRTWSQVAQNVDSPMRELFAKNMRLEKAFADAGGLLVAGIDPTGYGGVVAGYANHRQIELLVEAGFSAEQAVEIVSLNGARYLGLDDRLGSVEVGKIADLVVVDGDPASDIAAIRNVQWVFKEGVGYDSPAIFDSVRGTVGIR